MTTQQDSPQFAELGDVQDYIANAKVAWVQCRTKGHNMVDHDVRLAEEENAYLVIYRCGRCYTKREDVVNNVTGEVLSSKYYGHPDGYLLPKGTGRLGRDGRGLLRITHLHNSWERKRDLVEVAQKRTRTQKKRKSA